MEIRGLKVIVTGGAGFIGSLLVDELLNKGNKVLAYDNFDPFYGGKEYNLEHHCKDDNFSLLRGNILDYEDLVNAMKDVEVVFHMAAQPGVRYSIQRPRKVQEVNVRGTLNVLSAALANQVKKTIYASSSSVYGIPNYLPFDEKHPTNPNSPYAASKLATEKFCRVFHDIYGLNVVVLRYFSVYGPRQRPDQVIRIFINKIFAGKPIVIYGDGEQTRDFTYVDDVVRATVRAAEVEEANGITINVGSGKRISINKLLKKIVRLAGKEETTVVKKEKFAGDFPHTLANIGLAQKILNYRPTVDLEKGLINFIEWHQKFRKRIKKT
jgi:UDP-glucose 4-epimerase